MKNLSRFGRKISGDKATRGGRKTKEKREKEAKEGS